MGRGPPAARLDMHSHNDSGMTTLGTMTRRICCLKPNHDHIYEIWGSRGPLCGNSCPDLAGEHILEHAFESILAVTFWRNLA
jgi:hypothetical protein